jgi:hypothetical protein
MYDRYSLGRLLVEAGFSSPVVTAANSSKIPDWLEHQFLDIEDGKARKPDSLFMEAVKP